AFGDADVDGLPDLFVTHLTEEFHALYRQDRPGWFMDGVAMAGLQQQKWRGTGFGAVMEDFDADGWPDLVFVNGLVRRATPGQEPVLPGLDPWWARYAQRSQVFAGTGGGRFVDRSLDNPAFCGRAQVGRSLAMGDLDGDGAPDLVTGTAGGSVRLFRNVARRPGHHRVRLRLIDPAAGNRDMIGAEVSVMTDSKTRWGLLQPATSYLSSHEPVVCLGLSTNAGPVRVRVSWPSGDREVFENVPVDRTTTLERGKGTKEGG
ncbi:MAG: CRTAC1 family protein, partial [Verrucomicrobiales bacterium]|nr:CRTAC1 family protein [Verrucomicrobiales bacterium]